MQSSREITVLDCDVSNIIYKANMDVVRQLMVLIDHEAMLYAQKHVQSVQFRLNFRGINRAIQGMLFEKYRKEHDIYSTIYVIKIVAGSFDDHTANIKFSMNIKESKDEV